MSFCVVCNQKTDNPKFCSRSCAAKHNNMVHPKRHKKNRCKTCGQPCTSNRIYCIECYKQKRYEEFKERITLISLNEEQNARKYQVNSKIRTWARMVYRRSDRPKCCVVCGYNKHYEVCHKKPINSFSEDTPISVINDLDNLVALCPNHHWEFDNGLLSL